MSSTTTVICFALITPTSRKRRSPVFKTSTHDRKYAYVVWKLYDDDKRLSLRNVNRKVIPNETRDSATVAALLTKNARNPELFGEEIEFRKEK